MSSQSVRIRHLATNRAAHRALIGGGCELVGDSAATGVPTADWCGHIRSMRSHDARFDFTGRFPHEVLSEVVYFTRGHAPGVEPPIKNVRDGRRVEGDPSTVEDADDIRDRDRSHFVIAHLSQPD